MNPQRSCRLLRVVFAILALTLITTSATGCYSTPDGGEMGVVRNGKAWYNPFDWFDNKNIRDVVPNGSGNTWTSMGSSTHYYPHTSQQRFFKAESKICKDENVKPEDAYDKTDGADGPGVTFPTADGVNVTLCGTLYINTVFDEGRVKLDDGATVDGVEAIKAFDQQFATRTFDGKHPYDDHEGWSNFLGAIVEPVIINNTRDVGSSLTCLQIVSSCGLVQTGGKKVDADELAGQNNRSNVQNLQDQIRRNLKTDLRDTLGRDYFKNIQFRVGQVRLPLKVQDAVDTALAAFGSVSQSEANVKRARLDAKANEEKQRGYSRCPSCARQDENRAIPSNIQVWAPGNPFVAARP